MQPFSVLDMMTQLLALTVPFLWAAILWLFMLVQRKRFPYTLPLLLGFILMQAAACYWAFTHHMILHLHLFRNNTPDHVDLPRFLIVTLGSMAVQTLIWYRIVKRARSQESQEKTADVLPEKH